MVAAALVVLYYAFRFITYTDNFFEVLSDPISLLARLSAVTMLLMYGVYLCCEILWLIKRRVELKNGKKLKFNNLKSFEKKRATAAIALLLWMMVDAVFTIFVCGELSLSVYISSGAYAILFILFGWALFDRKFDIDKTVKKKEIIVMIVSLVVIALSFAISFCILPAVPDETALSEKIVAELDMEDKEVYVSRSRFAQDYDSGWKFEMFVSHFSKVKDEYYEYMIDYYSDVDSEYSILKKQLGKLEYYEFVNTEENYKYALVAVIDDYVISIHSPQENTAEILCDIIKAE